MESGNAEVTNKRAAVFFLRFLSVIYGIAAVPAFLMIVPAGMLTDSGVGLLTLPLIFSIIYLPFNLVSSSVRLMKSTFKPGGNSFPTQEDKSTVRFFNLGLPAKFFPPVSFYPRTVRLQVLFPLVNIFVIGIILFAMEFFCNGNVNCP